MWSQPMGFASQACLVLFFFFLFNLYSVCPVIVILTHGLSASCVGYWLATWYVCSAEPFWSTSCTLHLEQYGWTGWMRLMSDQH